MLGNHSPQISTTDNSHDNNEHVISLAEEKVILVQRRFIHIKWRARVANSYSSLSIYEIPTAISSSNVTSFAYYNLSTLVEEAGLTVAPAGIRR